MGVIVRLTISKHDLLTPFLLSQKNLLHCLRAEFTSSVTTTFYFSNPPLSLLPWKKKRKIPDRRGIKRSTWKRSLVVCFADRDEMLYEGRDTWSRIPTILPSGLIGPDPPRFYGLSCFFFQGRILNYSGFYLGVVFGEE